MFTGCNSTGKVATEGGTLNANAALLQLQNKCDLNKTT
jgi:hypothetical protein